MIGETKQKDEQAECDSSFCFNFQPVINPSFITFEL